MPVTHPSAPAVYVGAGTGLGVGFVTDVVHPSEGGHVTFAPQNRMELNFAEFFRKLDNFRYLSYDRVIAG